MSGKSTKMWCKDGTPTAYSFMCGNGMVAELGDCILSLFAEASHYDIKAYDYNNHKRLLWEQTHSLTTAKLYYRHIKHLLTCGKRPLPGIPTWKRR